MQFVGMQFDTTLCGDWAGNAFPGGMDKCNAAVEDPDNFARAFLSSVVWCGALLTSPAVAQWKLNYVSVYES
jgi:hypothetical protein